MISSSGRGRKMKYPSGKSALVLAISLLSCGAGNANPVGELRDELVSIVALSRGGGSGMMLDREELYNDDGSPYYVFTNTWYSAARLDPLTHCRLETLRFAIFVPADSTWVSQTFDILVYNNDPDHSLGTLRFDGYVDMPYLEPGYWTWFEADISAYDLHFSDDFWVCYHKRVNRPPFMLGDGSEAPPNLEHVRVLTSGAVDLLDAWGFHDQGHR